MQFTEMRQRNASYVSKHVIPNVIFTANSDYGLINLSACSTLITSETLTRSLNPQFSVLSSPVTNVLCFPFALSMNYLFELNYMWD